MFLKFTKYKTYGPKEYVYVNINEVCTFYKTNHDLYYHGSVLKMRNGETVSVRESVEQVYTMIEAYV